MNTRPVIDDSSGPVSLSASFNHDASCFSVGLDTGFCDFNAGIGRTEMLERYNYLAIVGGGKNPKFPQNKVGLQRQSFAVRFLTLQQVIIWDDAKRKVAITLDFKTSVLRVRLSKSRIVVALQNSIHVYAFSSPPTRLSVFETADNPLGLCCLGSKIVAFPGRSHGKVQIVELASGNVSIIPAHSSPLRAMDLSPDDSLLATASETGTLIRVYSTGNCARVAELRRGVDSAFIFSIAFSPSNEKVAVTSDKSTLHIFDLPISNGSSQAHSPIRRSASPLTPTEESTNNKWGLLGRLPLLPRVFSDVYSFASAHFEIGEEPMHGYLPALGTSAARPPKGVIGWTDDQTMLVIGAGHDGRWERFKIIEDHGGKRFCVRDGWKRYLGG
ncbi:MAG: hypothetical protein Q9160_008730 [Pyrenula sp. 1 TL-2023]